LFCCFYLFFSDFDLPRIKTKGKNGIQFQQFQRIIEAEESSEGTYDNGNITEVERGYGGSPVICGRPPGRVNMSSRGR